MKLLSKIYTVQVFFIDAKGNINYSRNWGWFPTKAQAEDIIINNITDIFEHGYYNYAMINEVPPGICVGHLRKENWYIAHYLKRDIRPDGYLKLSAQPRVKPCRSLLTNVGLLD